MAKHPDFLLAYARRSTQVGFILWLLSTLIRMGDSPETELIEKVVVFAVAVIVPLGLLLVGASGRDGEYPLPYRFAILTQPVCALVVLVSFLLSPGPLAAVTSLSLLVLDILLALVGLVRLTRRTLHSIEDLSIDAALVYPLVGGVSLVFYQLDIQPFGFGATIILLTVVHFHFAGFAAPIIASMTSRFLRTNGKVGNLVNFTIVLIAASMPIVAFGITLSPPLALLGAITISTGMILLSAFTLGRVLPLVNLISARILLSVSALSPIVAMMLAVLYSYSIVTKELIINIPTMAVTHGLLNAFGFSACGLLGWYLVRPVEAEHRVAQN